MVQHGAQVLVVDRDPRVGALIEAAFSDSYAVSTPEPDCLYEALFDDGEKVLLLDAGLGQAWEMLRVVTDPFDGYLGLTVVMTSTVDPWGDVEKARAISRCSRVMLKPFRLAVLKSLFQELFLVPER